MTTRVQPRPAEAQGSLWEPDGAGWRARIGVLTPHFDGVPESECWTMAPAGVSIYAARVPFVDARAFAQPPHVDTAAELLAAAPLYAIVYAFTSSSYLLGPEADTDLKARLEQRTRGIPVVIPCIAAVEALRACGLRRLALIHPPWFGDEVSRRVPPIFVDTGSTWRMQALWNPPGASARCMRASSTSGPVPMCPPRQRPSSSAGMVYGQSG